MEIYKRSTWRQKAIGVQGNLKKENIKRKKTEKREKRSNRKTRLVGCLFPRIRSKNRADIIGGVILSGVKFSEILLDTKNFPNFNEISFKSQS